MKKYLFFYIYSGIMVFLLLVAGIEIKSTDLKWRTWDNIETLFNLHSKYITSIGILIIIIATVLGLLLYKVYTLTNKLEKLENILSEDRNNNKII